MGEREEISRGLCAGHSYRAIAGLLGRAVSTISREVNNNGGRDIYRAIAAQERALDRDVAEPLDAEPALVIFNELAAVHQRVSPAKYRAALWRMSRSSSSSRILLRVAASSA